MPQDWGSLYAQMDDGELLALAEESADLTEEARSALWAELASRGLREEAARVATQRSSAQAEESPQVKLITIGEFRDPLRANLAKTRLESEGIPCLVADEHLLRLSWFHSLFPIRIRLQVRETDAGRAAALLREDDTPQDFLE